MTAYPSRDALRRVRGTNVPPLYRCRDVPWNVSTKVTLLPVRFFQLSAWITLLMEYPHRSSVA
ncbi:hypothetical protein SAMD00079811_60470 [Scytonema sp. HK-05]|nr:hypothetical protein SAMD00079811_60470 [Scytonema sp. HK-05]